MNVNPFRRHRRSDADSPVESALRRSLARHAFETPDADDLTRRILAAAENEPEEWSVTDRPRRVVPDEHAARSPWKTWGLPLVAAACVAAVVGIGATVATHDSGHGDSQQAATDVPSTAHSTVTRTTTVTPSPTRAVGTSGLTNVTLLDLTFYEQDKGFALASAQCIQGSGRCTALLTTTNGQRWTSTGDTPFDVQGVNGGCPADKCVDHIRFATDQVGYVYGPQALFMTKDGGRKWTPQSGGAEAIETLDSNVIRVRAASAACLPGCRYEVQTSAIGGTTWTTASLPGGDPTGDGVQLSRSAGHSYLLVTQAPGGMANNEKSTLYTSSDKGTTWTDENEPCPQGDSYQVAAGNGEDVTVLCRTRATGPFRVAVSTDGGQHFALRGGTIAYADVAPTGYTDDGGALPTVLAGDPSTALAVAGRGVAVSRDGGSSFTPAADLTGSFTSVGFESGTVGRAVGADGTQIWTTRNAGRTWTLATP